MYEGSWSREGNVISIHLRGIQIWIEKSFAHVTFVGFLHFSGSKS